ncbi:MAG: copper oxidase, partial [Gammaproteobacteria bacterium]|nr:copper oxidase [Gemmatimonadota bacterium]NIU77289.1 copper oxidase [Gammaproteobacteria bacterium]
DNSTYLDSQAIGPGDAYTYEQVYDGGGNRPKTPGDAIFHCHFYPHFAMGMWGLWRVHDVFEQGTALDADGRPAPGARALPDGEIAAGTPIPGLVPLPGKALAPLPGTLGNPGYPFYVPGIAGHRPPRPPLETVFDGGLARHVVQDGEAEFPELNTLDFHKDAVTLDAIELPDTGTVLERAAMDFHAQRSHPTFLVDPQTLMVLPDTFLTNGLPAAAGAPYADPCVDDFGNATGLSRVYKAASIQLDVKYNKKAWHFPQHRMFSLWEDVLPFINEQKPPEPMFLRTNTGDCLTYHL